MTIATTDGEDGPLFCGEFHDRIRAKSGDRAPAVAERQDLKHGVSAVRLVDTNLLPCAVSVPSRP